MSVGMSCPFCGSQEAELEEAEVGDAMYCAVLCMSCGAAGPMSTSRTVAAAAWNDRYGGD